MEILIWSRWDFFWALNRNDSAWDFKKVDNNALLTFSL